MKPDKAGIWEWFDEDGTKRLVEVCDCAPKDRGFKPHLRVFWCGGYYNVNDELEDIYDGFGKVVVKNHIDEAEWADRWGVRVANNGDLPEEQLYLGLSSDKQTQ